MRACSVEPNYGEHCTVEHAWFTRVKAMSSGETDITTKAEIVACSDPAVLAGRAEARRQAITGFCDAAATREERGHRDREIQDNVGYLPVEWHWRAISHYPALFRHRT